MGLAVIVVVLSGCAPVALDGERARPTSAVDANRLIGECMIDRGWDVTIGEDFIAFNVPTEQEDAYQEAMTECGEGMFPNPETFSHQQWRTLHEQSLATRSCLEDIGFDFAPPPSLQTFKDTFGLWGPYSELLDSGAIRDAEVAGLEAKCPSPTFWGL